MTEIRLLPPPCHGPGSATWLPQALRALRAAFPQLPGKQMCRLISHPSFPHLAPRPHYKKQTQNKRALGMGKRKPIMHTPNQEDIRWRKIYRGQPQVPQNITHNWYSQNTLFPEKQGPHPRIPVRELPTSIHFSNMPMNLQQQQFPLKGPLRTSRT